MRVDRYEKAPYSQAFLVHDFMRSDSQGMLTSGETLSGTPVVKIYDVATLTEQTTMVSNIAVYSDTKVRFLVKGGTAGEWYIIAIRAETSNGQKLEENGYMNQALMLYVRNTPIS